VQSLADAFKDRFERVGLEMNVIKTKGNDRRRGEGSKDGVDGSIFDRLHKQEGKTDR
jgi:hypothetical protein